MNPLNINFSSLLDIPVAFLLQEYQLQQLSAIQDEQSLSLMHWAIIKNDKAKVAELLHFNFPYSLCTDSNILSPVINEYQKLVEVQQDYNIPFCKKGYTSVHLNVYLHSIHTNMAKTNTRGSFKSNDLIKNQLDILNIFINHSNDIFSLEDNSGYSVLDYCFLLENIDLINIALKIDSSFQGLRIIKTATAIKIIETIQLKYDILTSENQKSIKIVINPFIVECLTKKHNYELLMKKVEDITLNNDNKKGKI